MIKHSALLLGSLENMVHLQSHEAKQKTECRHNIVSAATAPTLDIKAFLSHYRIECHHGIEHRQRNHDENSEVPELLLLLIGVVEQCKCEQNRVPEYQKLIRYF